MSNESPIFPIRELQHFTDCGFDPHIDYFQVMEEVRMHKTKNPSSRSTNSHFKLQKPIPKIESSKKIKKNKNCWWRNALSFFKSHKSVSLGGGGDRHIESTTRPVYMTESMSSYTAYQSPAVGPDSRPAKKDEIKTPYVRLSDLNMDRHHGKSTAAMPIYMAR